MKKEKPILFSTPMVRALLNTKHGVWPAKPIDPEKPYKSMTRRVIKPQPDEDGVNGVTVEGFQTALYQAEEYWINTEKGESVQIKPRYEKGDILWVRETFTFAGQGNYIYKADPAFDDCGPGDIGWNWKPSIFLPREAARLFLEVKSVSVERLQDISEKDAISEGMITNEQYGNMAGAIIPACFCPVCNGTGQSVGACNDGAVEGDCGACDTAIKRYRLLWDSLNAEYGYSWESNSWVWVYSFMRIEKGGE